MSSDAATEDALAEQLERILLKRVEADNVPLPTLPAVSARALHLINDPRAQLKQVAAAIEVDPLLGAQLLRLASSAAHGGGGLHSMEQAMNRLGVQRVKSLLVEASTKKLFRSKDERIQTACIGLWEHSRAVAVLARDVAALVGNTETEGIYLAGLLHDVGKPILAGVLLEAERAIYKPGGTWISATSWVNTIQKRHRKIGVALAEKWRLPSAVAATIADCAEFNPADRTSPGNFVCFANALSKIHSVCPGDYALDDAQALVMVGRSLLGLQDDVIARLTDGLKERVRVDWD